MGEIGGNDFNYGFLGNSTKEEVESYVPAVVKTISSAIQVKTHFILLYLKIILNHST